MSFSQMFDYVFVALYANGFETEHVSRAVSESAARDKLFRYAFTDEQLNNIESVELVEVLEV